MILTKKAIEVLENTKLQNPKILGWDNYKLINRLSEHWSDRKNIEEKITDEAIKRVKSIDLNERERDDTKEFLIEDDYIISNDEKIDIKPLATYKSMH